VRKSVGKERSKCDERSELQKVCLLLTTSFVASLVVGSVKPQRSGFAISCDGCLRIVVCCMLK